MVLEDTNEQVSHSGFSQGQVAISIKIFWRFFVFAHSSQNEADGSGNTQRFGFNPGIIYSP